MTVSGVSYVPPLGLPGPVQHASEPGFVVPASDGSPVAGPGGAGGPGVAARVSSAALLALQEHGGAGASSEVADREARQHGRALLAALAELQRALLSGGGGNLLERLLVLVDLEPQGVDPALARVIGAIRLRARIELARTAASGLNQPGRAS